MTYTPSKELRAELLKRYDAELTDFCLSKLSNEMRLDNGGFVMFERPKYINVTEMQKHKQHLESVLKLLERESVSFYRIFEKDIQIYSWVFDPPAVPEAYKMEQLNKCSDNELNCLKLVYLEELLKVKKYLREKGE